MIDIVGEAHDIGHEIDDRCRALIVLAMQRLERRPQGIVDSPKSG